MNSVFTASNHFLKFHKRKDLLSFSLYLPSMQYFKISVQ
jgi:hypothetical protein